MEHLNGVSTAKMIELVKEYKEIYVDVAMVEQYIRVMKYDWIRTVSEIQTSWDIGVQEDQLFISKY